MNVTEPSPETKLSSAEDVPPPLHPLSAIANPMMSANFFITVFQAIGDVLARNKLTLK